MNSWTRMAIIMAAVACGVTGTALSQLPSWFGKKTLVPEISAEKLREMQLSRATREQQASVQALEQASEQAIKSPAPEFVLVDVREPREYQVSIIPGAITAKQYEQNAAKYRGVEVICYCTIGYRSEIYARKLIDNGVIAKNFKGSILAWCEAQYPLETLDHKPTNRVHTYNSSYRVPPEYVAVW